MLVVTMYEEDGVQRFAVHEFNETDEDPRDVTGDFVVHELTVQDDQGTVCGWHIGKRVTG